MKKNLIFKLLSSLLLITGSVLTPTSLAQAEPDRQIGQLAKTKYLNCRFTQPVNQVVQTNTNASGQKISEVTLKTKQINQLRNKQLTILKNKKAKARSKENAALIVKNLKLCRKNRFDLPTNSAPDPGTIDETVPLPENQEYQSETRVISSAPELQGTCELNVKNIEAYTGELDSELSAPRSGALSCRFVSDFNYPVAVIVRSSTDEFLFSRKILPEQIHERKYHAALCTEFPGCTLAKKAAIALTTGGIKVQILGYEP